MRSFVWGAARALARALIRTGLFVLPSLAFAQGGPPLLTDDPGTPGDGNWEINIAAAWEHAGRQWSWATPLLDVNYGLGERIQLKYEVPFLVVDEPDSGVKGGLGSSRAGVKWRFLDETNRGFAMSIYPQLEFNNPTSSRHRRLVSGNTALLLPVQATKEFGRFALNLELGYTLIESAEDEWLYGLAAGYELTRRLELIGEFHGVAPRDFGDDELVFQVGAREELTEHLRLLFAIGRGVRSPEHEPIKLIGYVGVQLTF